MEHNNNEIKEIRFTQNDILKQQLLLPDGVTKEVIANLTVEQLMPLVNDRDYLNKVCDYCDVCAERYRELKDSIIIFVDELEKQKESGTETTIKSMIDTYKDFSREDKLEFYKKLMESTNLESSLDNLGYTWSKFLKQLVG